MRVNYIGTTGIYNLHEACRSLVDAFGMNIFLVGSSLERADFRDVDVRCILPDEEFDRLFPGPLRATWLCARWSLLSVAISEWLSARTGLPIDFQFQRMTEANAEFPGRRSALYFSRVPYEQKTNA